MKAKIFEIKRFAVHDGDGIRTTVFFKGCPLRCLWCHNPEGLSANRELAYFQHKCISCGECLAVCPTNAHSIENGLHVFNRKKCIACGECEVVCGGNALILYGVEKSVDELLPVLMKDKEFYDNSGGGVTLSGGECLLYADFCAELLKKLKQNNVHTAVDTCGFVAKKALDKVMPYTDIFLYDMPWNYFSYKDNDILQKPWIFGIAECFDDTNSGNTAESDWQMTSNICGVKESLLENITLKNVYLKLDGGVKEYNKEVPEEAQDYPEVFVYGRILPAKGIYFRHIDGLTLENVNVETYRSDMRAAFVFSNVKNSTLK